LNSILIGGRIIEAKKRMARRDPVKQSGSLLRTV